MLRTPTDHLDVLGRLHFVWGAFGVLTGASLAVLAVGTRLNPATAWGIDNKLAVVYVDADKEEPARNN